MPRVLEMEGDGDGALPRLSWGGGAGQGLTSLWLSNLPSAFPGFSVFGRTNPGQLVASALPRAAPASKCGEQVTRVGTPRAGPARAQWGFSATPRSVGFESQVSLVFRAL